MVSDRLYLHDPLFEFFVGDERPVLDLCFVCIDRVGGVFEDAGDLFRFVDTHADKRKDAEIGIEQFVVL